MFVVAPVVRKPDPDDNSKTTPKWPVVFEDAVHGGYGSPVAHRAPREAAQSLADALNAVLGSDDE